MDMITGHTINAIVLLSFIFAFILLLRATGSRRCRDCRKDDDAGVHNILLAKQEETNKLLAEILIALKK